MKVHQLSLPFYLDSRRMYWQQIWFTLLGSCRHFSHWRQSTSMSYCGCPPPPFGIQKLLKNPPSHWFYLLPRQNMYFFFSFLGFQIRPFCDVMVLSGLIVNKAGFMCLQGFGYSSHLAYLDHAHSWCYSKIWCDWIKFWDLPSPYYSWSDACAQGSVWLQF